MPPNLLRFATQGFTVSPPLPPNLTLVERPSSDSDPRNLTHSLHAITWQYGSFQAGRRGQSSSSTTITRILLLLDTDSSTYTKRPVIERELLCCV